MSKDKIERIKKNILSNLTEDLRLAKYRNDPNILKGHCYIASEALFYLLNNKNNKIWKPKWVKHENDTHWFIQNIETGRIIDLTVKQFKTKPRYGKGISCGFLTKVPSKRTQILLERIKKGNKKNG